MPVVTGVIERRGRSKVSIDGEFWAELDSGVAAERGIRDGAEFSPEELREARAAGERPLAMNRALGALGYRARTEHELRGRLLRAGYAGETVNLVVGRLGELGYLDDEEVARSWAREGARKKYGPRRIRQDLKRAGVDEEVVRAAVEEEFAGRSELEEAVAAARRRYNTGEGSDAQARRVYGFLARRGYSAEVCAEVARLYRRGTEE